MTTLAQTDKISAGTVRLIAAAREAGVPAETLKRFLTGGYVPQPKQLLFHAAACAADFEDKPNEIGFGGARGGGKTHTTFAQVALDDCQRIPELKVLFLRKVSKAATEAIEDLRLSVLKQTPHHFKVQKGTIVFPNKSRIIVGHFAHEKDIDNYLGLEYDIIVIEEATQLSASKIEKIKTCNRSSKDGFRPRIYYTTNPGGVGHNWFKKKFVEPFRKGLELLTRFIPSTARDNKKLNKEYVKTVLEPLTGWLREAWLNGNWDVFAGQYFSNFSYDRHVLKPNQMPQPKAMGLTVWCSLDYGFKHWMVAHLFCEFDGVIYCLDELARRKTLIRAFAEEIHQWLAKYNLHISDLANFYTGGDSFGTKGDTGETYADDFAKYGVFLRRANTNREQGWGKILQLFGDAEQHIDETVKISSNCVKLLEVLPILEHDPNKPNDVLKIDADDQGEGGDDAGDSFRYGTNVTHSFGIG